MSTWPLPGGTVVDPATDQNFKSLSKEGNLLGQKLSELEEEGLPPSGKAGGVLKGTYPNPEFAVDMATQAELDNGLALKQDAATAATDVELAAEKSAREAADATEKSERETADAERVKGPGSVVADDVAVFNGTTGKIVKDGGKTIAQILARENHTGMQLASTVSDFDTQVRKSRLDQMATPTANVPWGGKKITSLAGPTEALDAANKEYVDAAAAAAAAGLSIKNPVVYASTANISGFTEVSGLVLEKTAPLEIDGAISPPVGTRLLLKNQTTEKHNGLWEVTKNETFGGEGEFGGGGTFGEGSKIQLTRAADADTEAEVKQGMFILVTKGATNASTTWILTTENPIIPGTTAEVFAAFTAQPIGPVSGDSLEGTYPAPSLRTARKGLIACRLATNASLAAYTRTTNVLTANSNGALATIDGVAPAVSDYVLLKNGAAEADNGVYKITSLGSAGSKWTMERPVEMDASGDYVPGMLFTIAEGTKNLDRIYQLTTNNPITLNTTGLAFALNQPENWGIVEALPTEGALKNDTCAYVADKTNGFFWELVYDGEGEYPWKYCGGSPLVASSNFARKLNNAAYTSLPTDPLELTVPLKGDYFIGQDCSLFNLVVNRNAFISYAVGATAANGEWGLSTYSASTVSSSGSRVCRHAGIAAAAKIVEKAKTEAGECEFARRALRLTPIRVG